MSAVQVRWWATKGRSRTAQVAIVAIALLVSASVWLVFHLFFPGQRLFDLIAPAVTFVVILRGSGSPRGRVVAVSVIAFILMGATLFFQPADRIGAAALLVFCGATLLVADRCDLHRKNTDRLNERQQAILDGVPASVFLFDEAGTIHLFSSAANRMFGWKPEEIVGRPVWLLFSPKSWAPIIAGLGVAARDGHAENLGRARMMLGQRRDGSIFDVELSVSPRRSEHEQLFTGFCRDVSESQLAQTRLKTLQAQLSHMSRLTAMGQLATALAHELNQPLIAISNYVSAATRLIQQTPADMAVVDDALRAAAEQTLRAGQIIAGLRDFVAKTDGRRSVAKFKPIVDEAAILATAGGAASVLSVNIPAGLPTVFVDRIQIQQVLVNLIRNGIEAMEESGVGGEIWIEARRSEAFIQVTVSDNGPGVAPEIAKQLLRPFVSTKQTGLGIGLSISKGIIEAHGGKMWLDVFVAQGASFKFTLPITGEENVIDTE